MTFVVIAFGICVGVTAWACVDAGGKADDASEEYWRNK